MELAELFFLALALSLDAFGIILCISINKNSTFKSIITFVFSFGFFQFALSFLGGYIGINFNKYIFPIPTFVGGVIIIVIGILMLLDGFNEKEKSILFNKSMYFILGISVSIDALVIGFTTLSHISNLFDLLICSLFVGVITAIVCTLGVILSKYIKKIAIISSYIDYIGGAILIFIGLKMLFF
ncbi:manganese efflux pump [Clostridium tepidum]|jgi:putative Mn2+ efflux pump MntP|uniref:Putative manganese efflux pump MntP n=1 Tax=Clostridium tepidum TaxID=1962263 RepID=A0A1S9I1M8_9CLOT|nr:manganese efflux pump [Clostridium tepidum]MCR1935172.1 manganese efflux pump MntP family protein [Clostridium tepidum]MDU6877240.1 manganese efflux pump [Clostridium botulinum]OOO63105.1 hypothetical protein BS637_04670 [Clostridium tepidum]OOO64233.1 hypothetical protein BS638_11320 [Clostridium tepidum]